MNLEDEIYFESHDIYCDYCGKPLSLEEYEDFHDLCEECWNWYEEQQRLDEEYAASFYEI